MSDQTYLKVIQNLSEKYGYNTEDIKKITGVQFEFVAKTMKAGKFEGVRLPYFGTFYSKPGRRYYLNRNKNNG